MKIKVTTKHIKAGEPNEGERCPIALAIKESVLYQCSVFVDIDSIHINGARYAVPVEVQEFIEAFDRGDTVEPFELFLNTCDEEV